MMVPTDIGYVLIWILFLLFIQICIYLLISNIFQKVALPLSFTLSLLICGLVSWYLILLQLPLQIVGVIFLGLFIAGVFTCKRRHLLSLKNVISFYIVFGSFFSILLLIRYLTPDNTGIELFMDFGIIHSMYRYPVMPPVDLWFGGEPLDVYYYFGFWLFAAPGILLKIPPSILYTLALPSVFAYSAVNLYAIGRVMLKKYQHLILLILVIPIPALIYYWFSGISWSEIFSQSTFLIPGTVSEWAQASFLKGDVHPHVVSIMIQTFLLFLLIITILNYGTWSRKEKFLITPIIAVSLGVLVPMNTWNIFVFAPLVLLTGCILIVRSDSKRFQNVDKTVDFSGEYLTKKIYHIFQQIIHFTSVKKEIICIFFIIIPVLSLLFFLPYYLQSKGQILLPSVVTSPSPLIPFLLFWGFFFIIIGFHYLSEIRRFPWVFLLLLPGFFFGYGISALTGILMIYALMKRLRITDLLNFWGLFLILLCEFFYLNDNLIAIEYRFNTIFKTYSSAWLILGVSCAIIIGNYLYDCIPQSRFHRLFQHMPIICTIVILVSLIPCGLAIFPSEISPSLRSDAFLTSILPQDAQGIVFLRNMTGPHIVIEGTNFTGDFTNQGRISTFSGIPAALGQYQHEHLWRKKFTGTNELISRVLMIQMIYENPNLSLSAIDQLGADLVYIGPMEHMTYNISLPAQGFDTIYDQNGVKILQRNDYPAPPVLHSIDTSVWVNVPDLTKMNEERSHKYNEFS